MAKLYFYYSSMNAGKSTALLQSSYNYRERGMHTLVLAPDLDNRYGIGKVTSRIGLETAATIFGADDDLFKLVATKHAELALHCVLIDEAQFLSKEQVFQLGEVTDELDIPVLAYGRRPAPARPAAAAHRWSNRSSTPNCASRGSRSTTTCASTSITRARSCFISCASAR
jgi:hypothetical protein